MNLAEKFSKIPLAGLILLGLTLVVFVVELILAFLEKEKYRRIVKPFCMGLLCAALIVILPTHPLVYIGTFLGLVGDVFVILPKPKQAFIIGTFSFFLGHICYSIETIAFIIGNNLKPINIVVFVLTFLVVGIALYFLVFRKTEKTMPTKLGGPLYYSCLTTTLPIMITATVIGSPYMFFAIIGSSFFLISDILIYWWRIMPKIKRYDFFIMGTYLIAQFFIALGFIFTLV